jgi:peptide deformylase
MFESMAEEGGVGLAAVQIGVLKRVLVIDLVEKGFIKGAFINPHLIEASEEMQEGEEGCLSWLCGPVHAFENAFTFLRLPSS